jgi:hypothetical protein
MTVARMTEGIVAIQDSVAFSGPVTGIALRDGFLQDIARITLGLVGVRGNALVLGPLELLRFGQPVVRRSAVEWPIDGGLLAAGPGGSLRIEAARGRLAASVDGYRPSLPRPLYALTQLPLHHLLTRVHLLRVRGREPAAGAAAASQDRLLAAAIDVGLCAGLAALTGRRPRLRLLLGITAAYHVACWSISGRTLGGLVMGQRVVAIDGSPPSIGQSVIRLLTLPASWVRKRPDHDQIALTDVVKDWK